ncbi:hypothetical protein MSAN_01097000 [Mycena sanguinolenta]|uniref:Uncharacterized protein n=1 Tax=Mycena sanguinolenta TaxID=230812 RepID=A0A8H6YNH5_9AGAR|nr:hypothetical protein MSAN_01097000 [Mycena sanguinolenta]
MLPAEYFLHLQRGASCLPSIFSSMRNCTLPLTRSRHNRRLRPGYPLRRLHPHPHPVPPSPTPSPSPSLNGKTARLSPPCPRPRASPSHPPPGSLGSDVAFLIDELHPILKILPLEDPRGSEDIYEMDTSIMWGSEDLEWCNGGPAGCGGGKSMVQATPEEKEKFRPAMEIVQKLVERA